MGELSNLMKQRRDIGFILCSGIRGNDYKKAIKMYKEVSDKIIHIKLGQVGKK